MNQSGYREPHRIAQLLTLGSYTALAAGLVAETVLLSWEIWAIPLIIGGVAVSWIVHIRQRMNDRQRMWIYTVLMMATFFFYGSHVTSTFDMGLLMLIVMMIFTVSGDRALVTFCQITYYLTLLYGLIAMTINGTAWDSLMISRTALHAAMMLLAGWLARFIIRQWEQMFRESNEQIDALDQRTKRMSSFMANLSHELRTPVNAILGITEVMLDEPQSEENRQNLRTIRSAGNRLGSQVGDIMDYSELETGCLVVGEEPYALSSLFHDVTSEVKSEMKAGVELVIDVDADTPAGLVSDVRKLRRILVHIIGNSLKFTTEGGVYVHVTAVPQSYGVNLCIEVTDTGIGMDAEELEQVTRRFYQADSGKAVRAGGLGLGLPIAGGFINSLGGFWMIDSKPGEGTRVRLSIPQKVSDAQNCMSVANRERIVLGGYLNIGKFTHPYVREFYNAMILNVVQGLGTPMHRVESVEDLKKLTEKIRLTHLFVGLEEYQSAQDELERLALETNVIVVADDSFALPPGSAACLMPKPLYGFPIASILNSNLHAGRKAEGKMRRPGTHVLVVDDEPMNLNVAARILHQYGMHVTTADSGAEAIRLCRETSFDVVFMDHMMPEMDGVEAMKHIKELEVKNHRNIPVIALTANALSGAREMFLKEGFDGFVSKPIELPELERVLKRILPETGLNMEAGMQYCGNDAEFYRSLLQQFAAEEAGKREKVEQYFREEDYPNYTILVHALKSTAKMIGADALFEQAKAVEEAAKNGQTDWVKEHHGELMRNWAAVAASIRNENPEVKPPQESKVPASEPSEDNDILEFEPEGENEILEFEPEGESEILEFEPEGENEILEFEPEGGNEILEFEPGEEAGKREVDSKEKSGVLKSEPKEESGVLEFAPEGEKTDEGMA